MATDDFFRARLDTMIDMRHPLAVLASRMPWGERRASSYLSPSSCSHRLNIFSVRGCRDDGVALRVEGDGRDVRPVACAA